MGRNRPDRRKTVQSFLFALATAVVATGLAIAGNLATNHVPKTWHWASNGWFLVSLVIGFTVLSAALVWLHQSAETSDRPSPQATADGRTVQRGPLWAAAFATLTLA